MWEIVRVLPRARTSSARAAARRRTRRSATASGITAVDPVRMGLLFERFLSRERAEPPDIDLDIEHERREEVIQHVYAKYGREPRRDGRATSSATARARRCATSARRSGIPETALDRLSQAAVALRRRRRPRRSPQAGLDPDAPAHRHLLRLAAEILDFPRHLSIHPGGFLLGHEPVSRPRADRERDDAGAHRDPVGQGRPRGARAVQGRPARARRAAPAPPGASTCCARHRGVRAVDGDDPRRGPGDLRHDLPRPTRSACSRSRAARRWRCCRACEPRTFYDLVIEVSIVRPGPITGGMVHPYLRRRAGEEPVDLPAPVPRAGAREDARRAAVPGAGDAARDGRRRLHAGRGRPAAPRHGGVAAQRAHRAAPRAARSRAWRRRASRPSSPSACSSRSAASASTASPRATRRASR